MGGSGGAPPPLTPAASEEYNLWFVGVCIYVIGTLLQSVGANLQRLGAAELKHEQDRVIAQAIVRAGLPLFALGGIVCSAALMFLSMTLVMPMAMLIFSWANSLSE